MTIIFKNLENKGTLIFDIWEMDAWGGTYKGKRKVGDVHLKYKEVDKKGKGDIIGWTTAAEIDDKGKKVKFLFAGKLRAWDRKQLKALLKETGFSKIKAIKKRSLRDKTYFIATKG